MPQKNTESLLLAINAPFPPFLFILVGRIWENQMRLEDFFLVVGSKKLFEIEADIPWKGLLSFFFFFFFSV